MRRIAVLIGAMLLVGLMATPVGAAPKEKTWVCHATRSASNPWVLVHVAEGGTTATETAGAKHHTEDEVEDVPDGVKAGPVSGILCRLLTSYR